MGGLGLVTGSGSRGLDLPAANLTLLQRHGEGYALPHEIDHAANMRRLANAGCDRVLAIGSVGGLRRELRPGTFVCPDDFIALTAAPATSLAGVSAHRVPGFDSGWRRRVLEALASAGDDERIDVRESGVYWQANGPRLETPAEIGFVAAHADVIGMTIASECIAAGELGLAYAAVCVVDNFANGVAEPELTLDEILAGQQRHRTRLAAALGAALPRLQ